MAGNTEGFHRQLLEALFFRFGILNRSPRLAEE